MAVGMKGEAGEAAERGDVLILFSDWFPQHVDFDVAGFLGQLTRRNGVLDQKVESAQQRGGEAARRAEACACGYVRHAGNLQPGLNTYQLKRLPNYGMFYLIGGF